MATVDPLLRLAAAQNADELLLRAGQPPALRGRGGVKPLSMPTMDEDLIRFALREIVGTAADRSEGDERHSRGALGSLRVRWRTTDRLEVCFSRASESAEAPAATPIPHRTVETRPMETRPIEARAIEPRSGALDAPRDRLARILTLARAEQASDVVLADGRAVAIRVHGAMRRSDERLPGGAVAAMLDPLLDERRRARLESEGSVDVPLEISLDDVKVRFRVHRFRTLAGESAVLRPMRESPPTLRSLSLPDSIARFAELHDGLVLVTGPAGSGKSTSLVAMVEHLNRHHPRHVITLEDPIEYVFGEGLAVIHQREVGVHVPSFAEGLRSALRESPDVILLGELRDPETIAAAVTAAETGHLVLATLHAGSSAGAIDRMIDAFPEHQQRQVRSQLADVLRVVLGQRLVPARTGGRIPAVEILPTTPAVAHLIREGKTFQIPQALQTGRELGMVPHARALAELVRTGAVDRAAALKSAPDPQQLADVLGQ